MLTLGITAAYLLVGAGVFYGLEHDEAVGLRRHFNGEKDALFALGHFNSTQIEIVEELMNKAANHKYSPYVTVWKDEDDDTEIWSYGESLYFCLVTISTVGYGDMAPETDGGKAFLILFTIVGIPLMITVNLSLGGYIMGAALIIMRRLYAWCGSRRGHGPHGDTPTDRAKNLLKFELGLLFLLLLLAFAAALIFAALLNIEEKDWGYLDAFYFSWTTLTTIGYGDFTIENNKYITASAALLVLLAISFAAGSALVAMLVRIMRSVDGPGNATLLSGGSVGSVGSQDKFVIEGLDDEKQGGVPQEAPRESLQLDSMDNIDL